jgi:hypothetical protein
MPGPPAGGVISISPRSSEGSVFVIWIENWVELGGAPEALMLTDPFGAECSQAEGLLGPSAQVAPDRRAARRHRQDEHRAPRYSEPSP